MEFALKTQVVKGLLQPALSFWGVLRTEPWLEGLALGHGMPNSQRVKLAAPSYAASRLALSPGSQAPGGGRDVLRGPLSACVCSCLTMVEQVGKLLCNVERSLLALISVVFPS